MSFHRHLIKGAIANSRCSEGKGAWDNGDRSPPCITPMTAAVQPLEAIVGADGIQPWETLEPSQQQSISRATTGNPPRSLVYPRSQTELAAVMRHASEQQWRVLPCGQSSKLHWGGQVDSPELVISTARMNRLIEHAVGDLTVTVEAGFTFAELQTVLRQAGQFFAIDPSYPEHATLGGIIATGDSGSLRHRYNSVRDMLLGITFVRHDGEIVKAGGRVVKNVAGYDLMKLLTGSYGTLGIITQVTVRVYPLPQTGQTIVLTGDSSAIQQAMQSMLSSALTPTAIDFTSPSQLMVRFQSVAESVELQMQRSTELAIALGLHPQTYMGTAERDLWQRTADLMNPAPQTDAIVCKIGVRPSQAVDVVTQIAKILPNAQFRIHAGSGLGQLLVTGSRTTQIQAVRSLLQSTGGFLSVLQAPTSFKQQIDVWGYSGNALSLMRQVKRHFDPKNLLSPHRFVGGI